MFIEMSSATSVVLAVGAVLLLVATPQITGQAAGKVPYQQSWTQHAEPAEARSLVPVHQPTVYSNTAYSAHPKPYSAPGNPYSAPAWPYNAQSKAQFGSSNGYNVPPRIPAGAPSTNPFATRPSRPLVKPLVKATKSPAAQTKPYNAQSKAQFGSSNGYNVPTRIPGGAPSSHPFATRPNRPPVKPLVKATKPHTAPAKPYSTAVKPYAVPAKQHTSAARPKPAAGKPYKASTKPHQRPVQAPFKKQPYPVPTKQYQRPVAAKPKFPAGVTQYQYPGGQVQHYAPAKRVQGSKQKHGQVIKKRLTPAQLRQIQQWQIAVQFPPGTQVQPGTGGPPPGPAVPGHIWIQVPVPPQGNYPQQPVGPPVDQPAPVEPVPELPVEPAQPEVPSEPEQPEGPSEPEQPEEPFVPEQPSSFFEPEAPQETLEPEQPQETFEPEQPQGPYEPEQPEGPFEPEEPQGPVEPEQPDYPEEPAQTGETSEPEQPEEPLPVPGNQPIEPLPEEINSTEETPEAGEEYIPENPESGTQEPGSEDGSEGTWVEEPWGGDGSQELTEPDPAMALLLESCKEPRGQFPSASACNKFVNCWDGFAVEQQCPGGLVFSEAGFCDYPDNVDCGSRESLKPGVVGEGECPTPYGHYRSLESCGLFYVCVGGNPVKFECPEGLNYNTELGICDYPSHVDCGGTPSERPPPEEPVTEIPEEPAATESPAEPSVTDPAKKKFFKLKRVPAKTAVRPWPVHRAPSRGTPYHPY